MISLNKSSKRQIEEWIKVALLLFPFVVMSNFTSFSIDDDIYRLVLGIIRISICVYYVVKNRDSLRKLSPLFYSLLLMQIWMFASTFLSYFIYVPIALFRVINDTSCVVMIGMVIENHIDSPIALIKGLMIDYEIAIYSNVLSIIKYFPNNLGGRNYYFLEYYTALCLWLIPALGVAILYMHLNKKYVRGLSLIITIFITTILIKAATTIMAFVAIFGVIIIGLIFKRSRILSLRLYSMVILLASSFIIFVFSGGRFPLIDRFIENVLHRDVTFTGRTEIWGVAIEQIYERPIFGYGHSAQIEDATHVLANAAHNELLQRWFVSGFIGLAVFLVVLYMLTSKVDKTNNSFLRIIFTGVIVGVFTTYTMEAYIDFFRYFVVFFLAYHLDEMVINNKLERERQ